MEYAAAEYNVILCLRPIVKNISPEKPDLNLIVLSKLLSLLDSLLRYIEGCHRITAFCKENRILSFPTANVKHTVRPDWRQDFHDVVANPIGLKSPVIFLRVVSPVVIRHDAAVAKQRIHCGVKGCRQLGKHFNIGIGRAVFPFRHCLKRYVKGFGKLVLSQPHLLASFADYLSCFQMIHCSSPPVI